MNRDILLRCVKKQLKCQQLPAGISLHQYQDNYKALLAAREMNGACNRLGGGHRCLQILALLLLFLCGSLGGGAATPEQTKKTKGSEASAAGGGLRRFHAKTDNSQVEQTAILPERHILAQKEKIEAGTAAKIYTQVNKKDWIYKARLNK